MLSFAVQSTIGFCKCVLSWHGGVDVKNIALIAALSAAVLALADTGSVAFEEQKVAPAAPSSLGGPPPAAAAAGVQGPSAVSKQEGTEIRIPGLGKIGTLPKMDFGLELLYKAAETSKPDEPSKIDDQQDDLTIKGSIKHNF